MASFRTLVACLGRAGFVGSAISSWIFSRGSYEGSFRGELEKFARLAERDGPGNE